MDSNCNIITEILLVISYTTSSCPTLKRTLTERSLNTARLCLGFFGYANVENIPFVIFHQE